MTQIQDISPFLPTENVFMPNGGSSHSSNASKKKKFRITSVDVFSAVIGILGGVVLGTAILAGKTNINTPGGWYTFIGIVAGLVGTYLCLILLVLAARTPFIERHVGHDRMIRYHRLLGPWAVILIVLHVVGVTLGYSMSEGKTVWSEFAALVTQYPWMVPATLSFALFVGLALFSIRVIRNFFRYETWWVAHTYFYLAIVLSIGHQLVMGTLFSTHETLKWLWVGLLVVSAIIVIWGRIILPIRINVKHKLYVEDVVVEQDNVVSVYISGKRLNELKVSGGQFFLWRFLVKEWWWQAHPYSLSSTVQNNHLRITVKNLGDQSAELKNKLRIGTKVIVEGPYGIFTKPSEDVPVVCFAAGVGIAPINSMLKDIQDEKKNVTLLYRVPEVNKENIIFYDELVTTFTTKNWKLFYLPGPRKYYDFTAESITKLIPHISYSDVYVCGPKEFGEDIQRACVKAGVKKEHIHRELFVF